MRLKNQGLKNTGCLRNYRKSILQLRVSVLGTLRALKYIFAVVHGTRSKIDSKITSNSLVKSYRFGRFLDGLVSFATWSQPQLGRILWRCGHLSLSLFLRPHSAKFNLFHGFTLTITEEMMILFTSLRHVYFLLKSTRFQFWPLGDVEWPNENWNKVKKFYLINLWVESFKAC